MANYFLNRYSEMTGDDPELIRKAKLRQCLRVNTLKTTGEDLRERLGDRGVTLHPVPFLPEAYWFEAPFSMGATEEYLLGLYYLQEAASQLPPLALLHALRQEGAELSEARVLDMAAAPGSKTTQLAALMGNEGTLIAIDENAHRLSALENNLERCGVANAHVYQKDARHIEDLGLLFDGILLDAPCSGNFLIQRDWFKKRQIHDSASRTRVQRQLLEAGLGVLRPGGILIYSTCSLEPEEDERLLTEALPSGCSIVPAGLSVGDPGLTAFDKRTFRDDMANARRLWPHRHGTQGFFLAAIRKDKG